MNVVEGCVLLGAMQNLRWSEEDFESEVVFWIEEGQLNSAITWFGDAHVHDQSAYPISLRRYCATLLGPSTVPYQLVARLVDPVDVSLDPKESVPVVGCKDLNISV